MKWRQSLKFDVLCQLERLCLLYGYGSCYKELWCTAARVLLKFVVPLSCMYWRPFNTVTFWAPIGHMLNTSYYALNFIIYFWVRTLIGHVHSCALVLYFTVLCYVFSLIYISMILSNSVTTLALVDRKKHWWPCLD